MGFQSKRARIILISVGALALVLGVGIPQYMKWVDRQRMKSAVREVFGTEAQIAERAEKWKAETERRNQEDQKERARQKEREKEWKEQEEKLKQERDRILNRK